MYEKLKESLRSAYDLKVEERDSFETEPWKIQLRKEFLDLLKSESKTTLLEVGAGTGVHGAFFDRSGLQVVSTDLSLAMVEACEAKGLNAVQMDFLSLDFNHQTFDAVFALNCFLHVPPEDLPSVLEAMRRVLKPQGLLYWGQYGGKNYQGQLDNDDYTPQRFFSFLSDDSMKSAGIKIFNPVSFEVLNVSRDWDQQFQSTIWRRSQ
jgi:ubiquinone/menaquinone biosynthesis C-methylase UbiE